MYRPLRVNEDWNGVSAQQLSAPFLKYGNKTDKPVEPTQTNSSVFLLSLYLRNGALVLLC
jgi:hypothetical protein